MYYKSRYNKINYPEKWRKFRLNEQFWAGVLLGLVVGYFAVMIIGGFYWVKL